MSIDIEKWIKRSNRKNAKLISYNEGSYKILYFDKGKVRIGYVKDGMYCRYGISCCGAMSSESLLSLWSSGPGSVSEEDVKNMQEYLRGESDFPDFCFSSIKNLKW